MDKIICPDCHIKLFMASADLFGHTPMGVVAECQSCHTMKIDCTLCDCDQQKQLVSL